MSYITQVRAEPSVIYDRMIFRKKGKELNILTSLQSIEVNKNRLDYYVMN